MNPRLDRRQFLATAALAATGCASRHQGLRRGEPFDLLFQGGTILDGTGAAAFRADLAIMGDRIAGIGSFAPSDARTVVTAHGLHVAPGFLDIHTHSDHSIFRWPAADSRIRQGCTTEITGNCGSSAAPRDAAATVAAEPGDRQPWTDVQSYAAAWQQNAPALNQAMLVGHGTLRRAVLGDVDRAATAAELADLEQRLDLALQQGAIGLSTGLEYVPGIYAPPEEIERLAAVVARHDGLYASHMRSEEEHLLAAIDETLAVGRHTGVRVQVSHLKACGRPNWGRLDAAIARIEAGRRNGIDVMADAYPYTAYSTTLTILLEPWSREGGSAAIVERLRDPAARTRMRRELGPHVDRDPGAFDLVVIASVTAPEHQVCVGRNLVEIAGAWHIEPAEACLRLIEGSKGDVSYVGHGMAAEAIERVLAHPLVMVGSDGRSMAPGGRALERPHPRSYGTFPRVLGLYCRERHLFDLPTAVRKMTSMPAERARLPGRGRIAVGAFADLVAFDATTVLDRATYDAPQSFPQGIEHVLVNGTPVLLRGEPTSARPGRWLAAPRSRPC